MLFKESGIQSKCQEFRFNNLANDCECRIRKLGTVGNGKFLKSRTFFVNLLNTNIHQLTKEFN